MRLLSAAVATATVALAAPAAGSAATLTVEPDQRCYRERQTVFLMAQGYTPNGFVDFTREGQLVERLQADATGAISGNLTLPGLVRGQRRLTYVGTDAADPARRAEVTLLASATDVRVRPASGASNRRLTIKGRGFFFGGRTVWAHVRRVGRRGGPPARARTVRIGRVRGACMKVAARRRLFRRSTAPGRYRVQFDTFRRYRPRRAVEYDDLFVKILSRASAP
ncbi:MAG: hypothetical protein ACRDM7_12085 [Thermoleophilaceae bacterium]